MRATGWSVVMVAGVLALGGAARAAEEAAKPEMDPEQQAAMEAMRRLGSPSGGHQALEPLVGAWSYTAQWWMSPEGPAESMSGTAVNTLIFGGRFLQQAIRGEAMEEGQPPFEGLGFTGYDNLRKEYQTVWFDTMMTGMMRGTGQFDAAAKTLTDEGDFSCPVTGETHRWYRTAWTVVDPDHTTSESYSRTPEGREFKSMEIRYTRAQ
ncbi:MAG: DUF1579 domain-containing protein [Candidatus Omnitrophota bacterium]|nr:DUF1579 domain-containing protein [Candidatus Omnitrophota bacterium]